MLVGTKNENSKTAMKTTETTLSALVTIKTGYVFRSKPETSEKGNVRVIQNRDINDGVIDLTKLEKVTLPDSGRRECVRKGDIIFRSRGASFSFVQVTEDPGKDEVIVAGPLQLIRVKDTKMVDPAYLVWALSQDDRQAEIESLAQGIAIRTVPKAALEGLEIDLPPVERQRKIVEVATLSAEIKRLSIELAEKQDALVQATLNK